MRATFYETSRAFFKCGKIIEWLIIGISLFPLNELLLEILYLLSDLMCDAYREFSHKAQIFT